MTSHSPLMIQLCSVVYMIWLYYLLLETENNMLDYRERREKSVEAEACVYGLSSYFSKYYNEAMPLYIEQFEGITVYYLRLEYRNIGLYSKLVTSCLHTAYKVHTSLLLPILTYCSNYFIITVIISLVSGDIWHLHNESLRKACQPTSVERMTRHYTTYSKLKNC